METEEIVSPYKPAGNTIVIALRDLPGHQFDVVINATAASLEGDLLAIPWSALAARSPAYNMMYGKASTPFLAFARHAGAGIADSLGMLVEQAAQSILIWHGIRPHTETVFRQLRLSILLN